MLPSTVSAFIRRHALLSPAATHIVALSGGADSVALLRVLLALGFRVEAAHCNFHLRGAESDRDEAFCAALCQRLGVPLHRAHFDTRAYMALHKVSLEMAARELRYAWFARLRADLGAATVCVAHHSDDNVETVLINLLRGTGPQGLAGIKPRNGHIVRPLLCVSRQDILAYLRTLGQDWVTDSSNLHADVLRNKLRLDIIPALERVCPAAKVGIHRTARNMQDACLVLADAERGMRGRVGEPLSIPALLAEPAPQYALHVLLAPYGFTSAQTAEMAARMAGPDATGTQWYSATHRALIHRQQLLLRPLAKDAAPQSYAIPLCGTYRLAPGLSLRVAQSAVPSQGATPPKEPWRVWLDADTVRFPLTLRHPAQGDAFVPFGMTGRKLVSDFLTDRHRSRFQKEAQWLVADATGRIVWLAGERIDNRCRTTTDTRQVVEMALCQDD